LKLVNFIKNILQLFKTMTDKRTKKQIKEDAKAMRDINAWSRKVFGYTKNGWLYVDNKPVSFIGDDDEDEGFC